MIITLKKTISYFLKITKMCFRNHLFSPILFFIFQELRPHLHPYNTEFPPVVLNERADFGRNSGGGRLLQDNQEEPSFSQLIGGATQKQRLRNRKRRLNRVRSSKSIPGTPGSDFPVFNSIPVTNFNCLNSVGGEGVRPAGFYADLETQCQVWKLKRHFCGSSLALE